MSSDREKWREMFSEESQRLYYADTQSSDTSWVPPPAFCFADWSLGDLCTRPYDLIQAYNVASNPPGTCNMFRAAECTPMQTLPHTPSIF